MVGRIISLLSGAWAAITSSAESNQPQYSPGHLGDDELSELIGLLPPEKIDVSKFERISDWAQEIFDSEYFDTLILNLTGAPASSTINRWERGFLYTLACQTRVKNTLEIGTYYAGTTKLLALASYCKKNNFYSIDPNAPFAEQKIGEWPIELSRSVKFQRTTSSEFLNMSNRNPVFDLIFIDGNHKYPYALFDLFASDANLSSGGFIVMDNAELPDVMDAAQLFIEQNKNYDFISISCYNDKVSGKNDRVGWPASKKHDNLYINDKLKHDDCDFRFLVMRKANQVILYRRRITYYIMDIESLIAPSISIYGHAASTDTLHVECHFRGFIKREPIATTRKHHEIISLDSGSFSREISTNLSLPEKFDGYGRNILADIIVYSSAGDGRTRIDKVLWDDKLVMPTRNFLAQIKRDMGTS